MGTWLNRTCFTFIILFMATLLFDTQGKKVYASTNIVNPNQIYTYEIMQQDLKTLEEKYPDIIGVRIIGQTSYGRNIYAVGLGKGLSTSYINGSNHAREWISTNLTMNMIDQYAKAYHDNSLIGNYNPRNIFSNHKMWFVPMMNPDGVTLQQKGLSTFPSSDHAKLIAMNNGSRDFSRWKANARGVDLNRQFDANWSNLRNSPGRPFYERYKGSSPHSEKEAIAVIDFTYDIKPEMTVSYHSSGEIIFWNFNQTGYQYQRDLQHSRSIAQMTGYQLMANHSSYSGGGYTDWFIDTFNKPAFTPEISPYVGQTNVPLSNYDRIWQQNREVGLYIAKQSQNMYINQLMQTLVDANLIINENKYTAKPGAVISRGRTLVPVRGVLENLGAHIGWNAESKTVTITRDDIHIELELYSDQALVNGSAEILDAPAQLISSRTMVPIRFISETLGALVQWDQQTKTVSITD